MYHLEGASEEEVGKALMALLYELKNIDGEVDPGEAYFWLNTGRDLGFTDEELNEIAENTANYPLHPPKDESERMEILYYLLFMMKFDKKIHDEEVKFIHKIGFKLGFRDELTDDFIGLMRKYVKDSGVPPKEMMSVIKKYRN